MFATASIMILLLAACASTGSNDAAGTADEATQTTDQVAETTVAPVADTFSTEPNPELPTGEIRDFGPAPAVPSGDLSQPVAEAISVLFDDTFDPFALSVDSEAIQTLGQSEDPRIGWVLSDLIRFTSDFQVAVILTQEASQLLDRDFEVNGSWGELTDHLIAWDIPAPPGYIDIKRTIYAGALPEWEPFFDENADIDWRYLSWGGVRIDDRPYDTTDDPCPCIAAIDNPDVLTVDEADWLDDDDVVFGVEIAGESRAYPRQIMEVREMVNDTLGGRDFAMPYCTLCGAAQVWFTDNLPDGFDRPIMRTSGLLSRSNKVMFDLNTYSVFDTFLGTAQTGPLLAEGIELDQHSVVTSTWGDWKAAHPDTTVLIESLSLGRDPDFRNTRDADGPIFPIGDVDPRLAVHEDVLGVINADGTPIAFHVPTAIATLARGETIEFNGVTIVADGGGVLAVDASGAEIAGHQAFWFAWSQFHPETELWPVS